ncbi:MAG: YggS family pyridoxal phosphate-dependent enzyme [Planctomycetota bacterium]
MPASSTQTAAQNPKQLRAAYDALQQRIGEAAAKSGRSPEQVVLVAVTKYAAMDQVRQLADLGHMDFGESQVQQIQQRVPQLEEYLARKRSLGSSTRADSPPDRVRWHMIGHLQRNKVKQAIPLVNLVHSVDSLRLAEELHGYGSKQDLDIDCLLQVNVSGEATKSGIAPPAVIHLLEQIDSMMHLRCRGLMTMAPHHENPEECRPVFQQLRELFEEARDCEWVDDSFNVLSMGMSNDYEVAIEEGANVVRVGRSLFGEPSE